MDSRVSEELYFTNAGRRPPRATMHVGSVQQTTRLSREEPAVRTRTLGTLGRAAAACAIAIPFTLAPGAPTAHAKNGDTHVTGQAVQQTLDCNDSTLLVNGTNNTVNALGTCWAVTVMGSGNTVVADTVVDNIIVYGSNETVYFHNGDPFIWDRGRQLGMVNRIDRAAA
jgi:hypothetical protein